MQRIRMLRHNRFIVLTCLLSLGLIACSFFSTGAYAQAQLGDVKDLYERAMIAYSKQQYVQAVAFYQQIIKIVPTFAPAYNGLALANQAASGDEGETIKYLKIAIKYDPKMALAYDNLGRIYYARQDVDHAQENFEKALEIDPSIGSSQICLAWINLLIRSRPRTAIKYFKMALTASHDPKIYYGLGQAYFSSNQRAEAMEIITKLHEMGEDDLASRLEKALRENKAVNIQVDNGADNASVPPVGLGPLTSTPDKPTGTKVHLRGKLSDY